jgi:hypothetical protein
MPPDMRKKAACRKGLPNRLGGGEGTNYPRSITNKKTGPAIVGIPP